MFSIEFDINLTYNLFRGDYGMLIWFVVFIVILVIEILTVNLVSIWFAIGALSAMLTAYFTESIFIQIVVFILVSIISLLITKPLVKKFKGFDITPTNSDRVIGKTGEVIKRIGKNNYGEVKIFGNTWTATSKEELEVGDKVKVLNIEGVKLIVEKEEN